MNGLLDLNQTSGLDWTLGSTSRVYFGVQDVPERQKRRIQLGELADLETEFAQFEAAHEDLVRELKRHYVFAPGPSVSDFLRGHRRVPQVLIDALPNLQKAFPSTLFALRVATDDPEWEMLYATALWPGEPKDALDALDHFDNAWWIANSYPAGLSITFTYTLI